MTCIFPSDGPFFSRILAWRCVDWVNRTFRIDPKTFCIGFPRGWFASLRNQCFRVLRDATQLWYNFHNSHSILVVAFSSCVGIVAFLWMFVWLFINLVMREQTLIPNFAFRFCFVKLTLGRMPIFTRRSRASTFQIISARFVGEWHHGYFCLGYFFSSTHFDLVIRLAQKVRRHCGLLLCTIFGFVTETASVSLRTLAFFFPLVTDTFSSCNANDSLWTLYHGSRFNSPMPSVKVS